MARNSFEAYLEQQQAKREADRLAEHREAQAEAKARNASRGN